MKNYHHLSSNEREALSRGLASGWSLRAVASHLGRAASTLSREVRRHGPTRARYRATLAGYRASRRAQVARRPRKLVENRWLCRYVRVRLEAGWSPQQIAARLRRDYAGRMDRQISHETIYAAIYILPRGALRETLIGCLRQHRKVRRSRYRSGEKRGQIPNQTPLALRPLEAATRVVPGHWEGDLIKGQGNRCGVGTLVERTTRLVLLVRLTGFNSLQVCRSFARKLGRVPAVLRRSLAYDQGREMARHELLQQKLKLQTYFAEPHSPWQRGTNENTNGLLRQYLPRNEDLSRYTQRELNSIAERLNNRPRRTLDWMTPHEVWEQICTQLPVALKS